jgi:hypothetical protein
MKRSKIIPVTLIGLLAITFASCSSDNESSAAQPVALLNVTTDGISTIQVNKVSSVFVANADLTADEIEFLYAIREDEKLAKDVSEAFSSKYPTSIAFSNIAKAEATHIAAIENVLAYYEIEFPALGTTGVFYDEARQNQYNELLAKDTSLVEAYKATAFLEEQSIAAYATVTPNISNANIQIIVSNLMRGSSNHFKAYIRQLTTLGETYLPTLLSQATYDEIINSPYGQGNKYGHQGNGMNSNSGKGHRGQGNKGGVNASGTCTGTVNGTAPGTGVGQGGMGKGYRGGR